METLYDDRVHAVEQNTGIVLNKLDLKPHGKDNEMKTKNNTVLKALNTKYKVGDKVKLSDSHPRFPGRDAVVTRVFPTGFIKIKVDGAEDIEIAKRLISANATRSSNAVVAKALNAATAKNAISDKEREYTRLYELAQKNITFHAAKGDSAKVKE
jgi:hypothetical protein